MLYRLFFVDTDGRSLTLSGHKDLHDDVGPDVWRDTTTLYVTLFDNHVEQQDEPRANVIAAGILHIRTADFLKQLTTFRVTEPDFQSRAGVLAQFGQFFLGSLWDTYGPSCVVLEEQEFEREIPLYTTEGVRDAEITVHPFTTGDKLGLSLLRFKRASCRDVVMIIHGLTTSSDMYIMPEHNNLVSYLLDHDFTDVWTLDFRMSNRFPYNLYPHRFTMDDIALYDMPAAVAKASSRNKLPLSRSVAGLDDIVPVAMKLA